MNAPARWTGRVLSALVVAFLLFDAAIKLLALPVVTQTMMDLAYPGTAALARGLGVLTLACALLYAYPRTAVLGAILLTGLLGGAMASHLRIGNPLFTHFLFDAYIGVLAWGGLYLREPRLRALVPWGAQR